MSRDHHLTAHRGHGGGADPSSVSADEHHGLPPALHARVVMLGPRHAPALSELLVSHPTYSTRLLAVASPRMGLQAVQQAIATANQEPAAPAAARDDVTSSAPPAACDDVTSAAPAASAAASSHEAAPAQADAAVGTAVAAETAVATAPASVEAPGVAEAPAVGQQPAGPEGPSPHLVQTAKIYNQRHGSFVAAFNAATNNSCVGADGELDPVAVWHWQDAHQIGHDGRVGPHTTAAAQAAGGRGTAQPTGDIPSQRTVTTQPGEDIPAQRTAAPEPTPQPGPEAAQPPAAQVAAQPAATVTPPTSNVPAAQPAAGGGQPDLATPATLAVPARPDNGGPGSLARRALKTNGTADSAFQYLLSDNDATLNANLADYGNATEQRALLDAVISGSGDAMHVKTAFHAYWHVEVAGLDARNAAQAWPTPVLQSIHHQLKLLPDKDARAGAWTKLTLKNTGGGNRGFWAKGRGEGDFSIVGRGDTWTHDDWHEGYSVQLTRPAAAGAPAVEVTEGERFKAGEKLVLDGAGPAREIVTVANVSGNTFGLAAPLQRDHAEKAVLEPDNATAGRNVNWLDYTVRHEIAHSLDGGAVDGKGFYALGGWEWNHPLALDRWVTALGGDSAKKGNGIAIPDDMPKGGPDSGDRSWPAVKLTLTEAIRRGTTTLFTANSPLLAYQGKGIPIIDAVEAALKGGRAFYNNPASLYASNGKRFSINFENGTIQQHNEIVLADRVTNYATSAPAEFFAEAYAVFYEEAGKPDVTDADHGRLIRNTQWRSWMREHVHDRGHAPAGTGAVKPPDGKHGGGEQTDDQAGARVEAARRGKKSGNPDL